jgi:hypothetical protein
MNNFDKAKNIIENEFQYKRISRRIFATPGLVAWNRFFKSLDKYIYEDKKYHLPFVLEYMY